MHYILTLKQTILSKKNELKYKVLDLSQTATGIHLKMKEIDSIIKLHITSIVPLIYPVIPSIKNINLKRSKRNGKLFLN